MNQFDTSQSQNKVKGYLVVRVSTARGAIPLEGAAVSIRGDGAQNSGIIYSTSTNSDGITEKIELQTPPKALSSAPNSPTPPYAVYNVDVFKEGYIPLYFTNVPVFPDVISVQPAVMVPVSNAENNLLFPNRQMLYSEYENPEL